MSYDWFATIDASPHVARGNGLAERQKLALDVVRDRDKDLAKEKAREHLGAWFLEKSMRYQHPADGPLPTSRSIAVKLEWTLTSPFFSRAESEFNAIANPISRDRLTGLPILKASGAKGMMAHLMQTEDEALWQKLFGTSNDQEGTGDSGRIVFGDVVFEKVSIDLFSPHDRQHRVVDHPVGFEVVPSDAKATWGFLIFERVPGELKIPASLQKLLETARDLICDYGMSAKRTVGYGMGKNIHVTVRPGPAWDFGVKGRVLDIEPFPEPEPDKPSKREALELPSHAEALVKDGTLVCDRAEAVRLLTDEESERRGLTKQAQRANVEKRWLKKDKAGKLWDECKRILDALSSGASEELQAKQRNYDSWLERKAAWEKDTGHQRVHYEFPEIDAAIDAVATGKEVPK